MTDKTSRRPVVIECSDCGKKQTVLSGSAWANSGVCTPCWSKRHPLADARYRAVLN